MKTLSAFFLALLIGLPTSAQNFRQLRDVKVNETSLDLSKTNCTVIPRNAMHSRYRLRSLVLPLQLDSVGSQAFFACKGIGGRLRFPRHYSRDRGFSVQRLQQIARTLL